jgi:hypothetical protein
MAVDAVRHALQTNGQHLFNPLYAAAGSAVFGASSLLTGIVEPLAGLAFGAPLVGVFVFTLCYYNITQVRNFFPEALSKIVLSAIAAFAASMLVVTACGFSVTLLEGALLILATLAFCVAIAGLIFFVIECGCRRW